MAKKIYIGEILSEVMNKVALLQTDMQDLVNQMILVTENTSYLENLYLATGRRSNVTYSAGDNTLAARKKISPTESLINYTLGTITTLNHTKGNFVVTPIHPDKSGFVVIDCAGIDTIKFTPYVWCTAAGYCGGKVLIDGVELPDSNLQTVTTSLKGTNITIDVSLLETIRLDVVCNGDYYGKWTYELSEFQAYYNDGKIETISNGVSAAVKDQKITIADNFDTSRIMAEKVSGISWAGWDCITWNIENDNSDTKVNIITSSGDILLEDYKSGKSLSTIKDLDIYLDFKLVKRNNKVPAIASISYLYLT